MIKYSKSQPTYVQISHHLLVKILNEELIKGDCVGSVRNLAKNYMVTTKTIQKVFDHLETYGVVVRRQSMGIFVNADSKDVKEVFKELAQEYALEYINKLKNIGYNEQEAIKLVDKVVIKND